MAQCPRCGAEATGYGKFCGNCGAPLAPQPAPRRSSPWLKAGLIGGGVLALAVAAFIIIDQMPPSERPGSSRPVTSQPSTQPSSQPKPAQPSTAPSGGTTNKAGAYFVSRWRCWSFGGGACPVGWEQMIVKADGTYTLANVPGTWRMDGNKAVFSGPLASLGPAEPYGNDQFIFHYVDSKSGFGTDVFFVKW